MKAGARSGDALSRAALLVAMLVLAWFAATMLRVPTGPILGDYAEWTYHGVLLRDLLQAHPDPAYTLKHYPVPNSLTTVGLGLLMLVLPWTWAAKCWLLLGSGFGLWSGVQLQRAAGAEQGWKMLLLPSAVLFGSAFWYGFINFLLGTYCAMLVCGLLLRRVQSRWAYAALLALAFFCHMIPFAFALLALGLYAAQTRRWRLLLEAVPSLGLTLWYLAGRAMHGNVDGKAGMVDSVAWGTPLFVVFKGNTYLKNWGFVNPALSPVDSVLLRVAGPEMFWLLFVLNGVVALVMLGLFLGSGGAAVRASGERRFFWIAVALFVAVALLLPGSAAGISDPGGRMMQVAVWCGLCVVPVRVRWVQALLGVSAGVLLLADCVLFAKVAMAPGAVAGEVQGSVPDRVREFGHVYYAGRLDYYGYIERGAMEQKIYPTALFLRK